MLEVARSSGRWREEDERRWRRARLVIKSCSAHIWWTYFPLLETVLNSLTYSTPKHYCLKMSLRCRTSTRSSFEEESEVQFPVWSITCRRHPSLWARFSNETSLIYQRPGPLFSDKSKHNICNMWWCDSEGSSAFIRPGFSQPTVTDCAPMTCFTEAAASLLYVKPPFHCKETLCDHFGIFYF